MEARDAEVRALPALVVNPTKLDTGGRVRQTIVETCVACGWHEPLWFETTPEDSGVGQARKAVAQGADVVMAFGGDGTVRCVAEGLAGSGIGLGLLPAGTGNLLATNVGLEDVDLQRAVEIALTGDDRPIDLGWVEYEPEGDPQLVRTAFLVMAGLGLDGKVMASTPELLKSAIGPVAYAATAMGKLVGSRAKMHIELDNNQLTRKIRSAIVGNCGSLQGGVALMPEARLDDGYLDMITVGPRGLWEWVDIAAQVVTQNRRGSHTLETWRSQKFKLEPSSPQPAQVDGDAIGTVRWMSASIQSKAITLRMPERKSGGEPTVDRSIDIRQL